MKADEKRKPGTMAKLFSSHPPHGSRIKATQESIDELLPSRPEYVVTTSEFLDVKSRLQRLVQRRDGEVEDPNRPTLRRSTNNDTIPTGEPGEEGAEDEDERPTLKRRK